MADKILITGASGAMGRLLIKHFLGREPVIGLDRRPFMGRPMELEFHQVDLRKKKAENLFRRESIKAVYHLQIDHNLHGKETEHHQRNVRGTMKLLEYCERYKVPKLIFLSSCNVYGPNPMNPNFLSEDAPLGGAAGNPAMQSQIEAEMYVMTHLWKQPEMEVVILRPVHIVGPTVHNPVVRYLRMGRVPTLMGFDPMLQLIHEDDVVHALALAARPGIRGIYNVVGPGQVPLSVILKELGAGRIPIPHPVAMSLTRRLWEMGLSAFSAPELNFLRFVCNIDGARATRDLGFVPRYSLPETIRSIRGLRAA
ncbi:MAG: SDR family oxidoreductase [Candidatus Methylomirabilis sp.]|nr:SDR family oxidoreductase [Deltaproteobacteria bacterium]